MSQTQSTIEAHRPVAATGARPRGEGSLWRTPTRGHAADTDDLEPRARGRCRLAPVTVDRLIRCCRLCAQIRDEGREFVSSREIGELLGCRPSLIRKDLARLGKLGTRGHGYRIAGVLRVLEGLLGGGGPVIAVIVGTGALGAALLTRGRFARDGFRFAAAFDTDPSRAGTRCDGLTVNHVSRMPDVLGALGADIGVLAVSEAEAQGAAQLLAENGVRAILNLTPAAISLQEGVVVTNIDLGTELKKLAFLVAGFQRRRKGDDAVSADGRDRARPGAARRGRLSGDITGSRAPEPAGRGILAAVGGTRQ
jgi:redox-sensing transcriptional repressor